MLMKTRSFDDATAQNLMERERQQQKRSGIQLGTKTFPSNVATIHRTITVPASTFSPQARRARAVASRQRRLTDSMVLEEASDTYLRAFSEQVTRLKRLTDGLQRFDAQTPSGHSENGHNNDQCQMDMEGNGESARSNWGALSSSLASPYRCRSSSTSDARRLPPPAALTTSNSNNGQNRNGDAIAAPEWQRPAISPSPTLSRPTISQMPHTRPVPPNSLNLPSAHNNSFYECNTSTEEVPYGNQQKNVYRSDGNGPNRYQSNGVSGLGNEKRCAAPLAKPEPLADLEKPALDHGHFAKQAATASPQARRFGSSTVYPQQQKQERDTPVHQKTIRFADEEDFEEINHDHHLEDDPGIMSEAETSATSGSNSAVRRRQFFQPKRQEQSSFGMGWNAEGSGATRFGDSSPSMVHRPLARENVPSTLTNSPSNKSGVVFLQFQGETKRAVLPVGHDGTSRWSMQSMDDVRILFLKAFQTEMSPDYLQSPLVKIYIQDPAKTDVFYELDDLNDVKDRAILKLHECRPNSPPPIVPVVSSSQQTPVLLSPPTEHRRVVSPLLERASVADPNLAARSSPRHQLASELRTATIGYPPPHYHQHQSSSMSDDMNYFSEPEFDAAGDYRLRKSSSTSNYTPAYALDQRRYGTIDRCYGAASSGGGSNFGRGYRGVQQQVPPKPERHFGPGVPSGGRTSVRQSQSPPRGGVLQQNRPAFGGHSTDPEEAYGVRTSGGYRDYAPSPTSDVLMDTLYNRPPSVSRSGSVTPVIDEEARIRMINMEKQLANLSSLVHSALMSKGGNETVYKDLEMLRREILGNGGGGSLISANRSSMNGTRDDISDSGSVSRFSDISSEKGSYQASAERDGAYPATFLPITSGNGLADSSTTNSSNGSNALSSPEVKHTLKTCKRRVGEIQTELKNLRRLAQLNAQSSRDILKDSFDRIKVILNTNKHLHMFAAQAQQQNQAAVTALSSDRNWADQEQERYRKSMQKVEQDLGDLEKHVEGLRQHVINGERKLRMSEVESFTDTLGQIGRLAAHLKTNFPMLQDRLKQVMGAEMEKVVREEKFLKDEPLRVDTALKRCKKLTNTMVTMKKLAMVQDPAAYYGNANRSQSPVKPSGNADSEAVIQNGVPPPAIPPAPEYRRNTSPPKEEVSKTITAPSPLPKPSNSLPSGGHVLDSLLEELQNVAKGAENANGTNGVSQSIVNGNGTEKNGALNGNGEKRVGFADEVQVLSHNFDSNDSDTIKRAPKVNSVYSNSPQPNGNGYGHQKENGSVANTILARHGPNGHPNYNPFGLVIGSRRRSASPLATTPGLAGFNLPLTTVGTRSHSGTPLSMTSDPSAYHHHPPPPPPRSSSRTMLTSGNGNGNGPMSDGRFKNFDLDELKQQLLSGSSKGSMMMVTGTPTAIVQTNAVDEEPRLIKSASSSESVNSQDGREHRQRHQRLQEEQHLLSPPGKPPPPPPPPRNKQEMLEQRQHELLTKQLQQQNRYGNKFQL